MPGTKVKSERGFYLATMPIKKANNGYCTLTENQIKFNHIRYRLTESAPGYEGGKLKVLVKYDPYDIRHIWAIIDNRWVQLNTNDSQIRECLDKGIKFPHLEIYPLRLRQQKLYRTGKNRPSPPVQPTQVEEQSLTLTDTSKVSQKSPEKIKVDLQALITPRTEFVKGGRNGH